MQWRYLQPTVASISRAKSVLPSQRKDNAGGKRYGGGRQDTEEDTSFEISKHQKSPVKVSRVLESNLNKSQQQSNQRKGRVSNFPPAADRSQERSTIGKDSCGQLPPAPTSIVKQ